MKNEKRSRKLIIDKTDADSSDKNDSDQLDKTDDEFLEESE